MLQPTRDTVAFSVPLLGLIIPSTIQFRPLPASLTPQKGLTLPSAAGTMADLLLGAEAQRSLVLLPPAMP